MAPLPPSPRILVLGIGNLLWADEGFGVRAVERFNQDWRFPAQVRLMDGGTQGLYLLPYVQEADALLVFDAVDYGDAPGALREVTGDKVPRFMGAKKMSLHQTGFQEVLAAAALTGRLPQELVLIGVQPEQLEDFGGSLSPSVHARLPAALDIARKWLERWGAAAIRRDDNAPEPLADTALSLAAYEAGRPDAMSAWREGDARFLNLRPQNAGAI
ncbi:hydrogenase expression/formation protein [Betaproteobacteria bacterium]|nr:hydrogenase expression/formation protein [Betaproteobacteria bacterium]GHU47727.1 hydrogenase expression/formation protein [Betaproteobacteria bacterium]